MMKKTILLVPFLLFTSCDELTEIASRKNTDQPSSNQITTGAWDLPYNISGITYTDPNGNSLVTDSSGQLTCTAGETLTFSIGSIVLGTAVCSDNITLEDIAGVDDSTDLEAVQLTLLLISLDDDNDPNNGIEIVDTATDYEGVTEVDLSDPTEVADLIQVVDPGTPVVPVQDVTEIIEEAEETESNPTVISSLWNIPIDGLTYSTPSGGIQTTNSSGIISCVEGETITFYIGNLLLASIECKAGMTIADLAGTSDTTDDEAIQLALLLLSIDQDGNPDNGIQIVDSATDYTGTSSLDLTDSTDVASIVQELNPGTAVLPVSEVTDVVEVATGKKRTTDSTYLGLIASSTDELSGQCPTGAAALTITTNDEVSLSIPSSSGAPLDIAPFLVNGTVEDIPSSDLSLVTFPVPDPSNDLDILDCSGNGGYSGTIKVEISDVPIKDNPEAISSTFKMSQVCTDATELVLCEGQLTGSQ